MKCLQRYVEQLGLEKTLILCDVESAAKGVAMRVARDGPNAAPSGPRREHARVATGLALRFHSFVEGMTRTWRRTIERKHGVVLELQHPHVAQIARHASCTHDRFLVRVAVREIAEQESRTDWRDRHPGATQSQRRQVCKRMGTRSVLRDVDGG